LERERERESESERERERERERGSAFAIAQYRAPGSVKGEITELLSNATAVTLSVLQKSAVTPSTLKIILRVYTRLRGRLKVYALGVGTLLKICINNKMNKITLFSANSTRFLVDFHFHFPFSC